jgi:hypothetical protein
MHHYNSVNDSLQSSRYILSCVSVTNNVGSGLDERVYLLLIHSLTRGAEPFLRSHQLCSYSRTSQHFMEPKGSLPCSQEPSTGPYPERDPIQTILTPDTHHQSLHIIIMLSLFLHFIIHCCTCARAHTHTHTHTRAHTHTHTHTSYLLVTQLKQRNM